MEWVMFDALYRGGESFFSVLCRITYPVKISEISRSDGQGEYKISAEGLRQRCPNRIRFEIPDKEPCDVKLRISRSTSPPEGAFQWVVPEGGG